MKYKIYTLFATLFIFTTMSFAQTEDDDEPTKNYKNNETEEDNKPTQSIENNEDDTQLDDFFPPEVVAARKEIEELKNISNRSEKMTKVMNIDFRAVRKTEAILNQLIKMSAAEIRKNKAYKVYVNLIRRTYYIEPEEYKSKLPQLRDHIHSMANLTTFFVNDVKAKYPNSYKEKCSENGRETLGYVDNGEIYLCDRWFSSEPDCMVVVMIHEHGHLVGLIDVYDNPGAVHFNSAPHIALLAHSFYVYEKYFGECEGTQ